jgi:hypothetical protein
MATKPKPSGDTSWTEPESQANEETLPKYPYNHATISESGHSFELDDTPGRERIRLQHGGAQTDGIGTFFEIQSDGTRVHKIVGSNYEIVAKDNDVVISGMCYVTIKGNSIVNVMGNKYEKIAGDYILEVGGKLTQTVGKTSSILSNGDMTVGCGNPVTGRMKLATGDHLYLQGDLVVSGALTADMITSQGKVNAGTGMRAGPLGFVTLLGGVAAGLDIAVPLQVNVTTTVNAGVSVNSPLINGVIVRDVRGTMEMMRMVFNTHRHPSSKGPTGTPFALM